MDGITPKPIQSQNQFNQGSGSGQDSSTSSRNDDIFLNRQNHPAPQDDNAVWPPRKASEDESVAIMEEPEEVIERNFVDNSLSSNEDSLDDKLPLASITNQRAVASEDLPINNLDGLGNFGLAGQQNLKQSQIVSDFVPSPPPEPKVFLEPTPNTMLSEQGSSSISPPDWHDSPQDTPPAVDEVKIVKQFGDESNNVQTNFDNKKPATQTCAPPEISYKPKKTPVGVVLHSTSVEGELVQNPLDPKVDVVASEDEFDVGYKDAMAAPEQSSSEDLQQPAIDNADNTQFDSVEQSPSQVHKPEERPSIADDSNNGDQTAENTNSNSLPYENDINAMVASSMRIGPDGQLIKAEDSAQAEQVVSPELVAEQVQSDSGLNNPLAEEISAAEQVVSEIADQDMEKDAGQESKDESLAQPENTPAYSETEKVSYADSTIQELELAKIVPNPYQPRKVFNQQALQELADSISEHGVIQPLVVTETENGYELVVGERRFRASQLAGLIKVPAIVKKRLEDQTKLEVALIENIQRQELNAIEEAQAYERLIKVFNLTQDQVAQKVGKSRPAIANTLRLLNLPAEIQRGIIEGKISEGHGRAILGLPDIEKQILMYNTALEQHLNVRQVEAKVRELAIRKRVDAATPDPQLMAMESKLRGTLGTQVKIQRQGRGGKIMIDFFSEEELQEIIKRMAEQDEHGDNPPYFVV